jgi:peptidoglycan LD-endopeptidase LytH
LLKLNRVTCLLLAGGMAVLIAAGGYLVYRSVTRTGWRSTYLITWLNSPELHPEWSLRGGTRCGDAPFLLPTNGYIGFLWDDSFRIGHRHQGIDIFGGSEVNTTPVVAAYAGYLTRLPDWKSSIIIRIPDDPFRPGRQIWTYYTHMANSEGISFISPQFPPGSREIPVEAGVLLGYQGNFSGTPGNPTGVHLHFSIVLDGNRPNSEGMTFLNELDIRNTLDPSAYLGLPLNANQNRDEVPICR